MARHRSRARRLVVDGETFLWSVRHGHRTSDDGSLRQDCRETLALTRLATRARLLLVFAEDPGRLVPDGLLHSGAVGTADGVFLNLHEPGTVRALLDEARARGWAGEGRGSEARADGWRLFDAVTARRGAATP